MKDYSSYVIYADYDFTLTNMRDELHPENVSAVQKFIGQGGHFGLASGRGREETAEIQIRTNVPLILDNGGTITFPDEEPLFTSSVDQAEIRQACIEVYKNYPTLGITVFADEIYQPRAMDFITRQLTGDIGVSSVFEQIDRNHEVIKRLAIDGDLSVTDQAVQMVRENFPDLAASYSAPGRIDVLKKGITKGSAVKWLKDHYFKNDIYILCAGDNVNDLDMIREADISFAVGNAVGDLKKEADVILPSCDTPCILEMMRWIDGSIE